MKVFAVVTVGRQVDGDMITVRFEKAYARASKADEYAKSLGKTVTESIPTAQGPVQFVCERGVHEFDVEEDQ